MVSTTWWSKHGEREREGYRYGKARNSEWHQKEEKTLHARELCHDQKQRISSEKTTETPTRSTRTCQVKRTWRVTPTTPTTQMRRKHKTKQMGTQKTTKSTELQSIFTSLTPQKHGIWQWGVRTSYEGVVVAEQNTPYPIFSLYISNAQSLTFSLSRRWVLVALYSGHAGSDTPMSS